MLASRERVTQPASKHQKNAAMFSQITLAHVKEKILCFCQDNHDEQTVYQDLVDTCTTLIQDPKNVDQLFQVFSLCSWIDRQRSPIISKLFHELTVNNPNGSTSNSSLLLGKLESTCKEFLQVLTLLGKPSPVHFSVAFLLSSMSRLDSLPRLYKVEVLSYLEELTRAFWPYCMPNTGAPSLWDNDSFVDALSDILIACGESMESQCPVNMDRTFQMVDRQLVSNGISPYSRYRLLEVRELRTLGWKMKHSAKDYYKTAYKEHIVCLKDPKGKAKFGDNKVKELCSERPGSPIVLRIHESSLTLDSNAVPDEIRERADSYSSGSDTVFTEEDDQELEAQLAVNHSTIMGKSCGEETIDMSNSAVGLSKLHLNKQPAAKISMSTFVRGNVVPPRRPHKSDSVAFCGVNSDKRRIFSADTKDPRNYEFCVGSTRMSTESDGSSASSTTGDSAENLGSKEATEMPSVTDVPAKLTADTGLCWRERRPVAEDCTSNVPSATEMPSVTDVPAELTADTGLCWRERRPVTEDCTSNVPSATEMLSVTEVSAKLTADTGLCWRERHPVAEDCTSTVPSITEMPSVTDGPAKLSADTDSCWRERHPVAEDCTSNVPSTTEMPSVTHGPAKLSADTDSCWRERNVVVGSNENIMPSESNAQSTSLPRTSRYSGGFGQKSECPPNRFQRNMSYEAPRPHYSGALPRQNSVDSFTDRGMSLPKEKPTGGFGSPESSKTNSCETLDESHRIEVHLDEEEAQRLRGLYRNFFDIQRDSGCQVVKKGNTIELSGNFKRCKAAKQKIYELVSAPDEEFGIIVPLPEKVLEVVQDQSDKEVFLARLAVLSGANVRQITGDQIFLSGRRVFVTSAKSCLAKFNVMLKYRNDPDIGSSVDEQQRGLPLIQQLFENVEAVQSPPVERKSSQNGTNVFNTSSRIEYSRSFLLSCAMSPSAKQRPDDLSLDRDEDWVKNIVLTKVKQGDLCLSGSFVQCCISPR